jgi:hypothetical protein
MGCQRPLRPAGPTERGAKPWRPFLRWHSIWLGSALTLVNIPTDALITQHPAGFVHAVEGFVELEAQFG